MAHICDYVISQSDVEAYLNEREQQTLYELKRLIHDRKCKTNLKYLHAQLEELRQELILNYGLTDERTSKSFS